MPRIGSFFKRIFGLVDEEENPWEEGNVTPIKNRETVTIFIYGLNNYDEVRRVIDEIKAGKIVVVNFESADKSEAVRALDFVSGAIYALEGSLEKVGDYVFLAVPRGVEVEEDIPKQTIYPPNHPQKNML